MNSAQNPSSAGPETGWLIAHGLEKAYRGRRVVRDASLAVRSGEAVGLLGPNGAGKTTIFYMITGLVPADGGRITLDGHDITPFPMYRREPYRVRREAELDHLLEEFDIARLRKSPSISLSGGERRRCEIARALASRPSFMLLDEPFAGIDPIAVGDIRALVRQLTSRNIGVLITDHNVRETLGLIDRAYIIHSGQVLMEGTPEAIIANDDVRRVYLGDEFRM